MSLDNVRHAGRGFHAGLFYSSFEDVDLVIGAAAILFIADVVSSFQYYLGAECMKKQS